MCIYLRINVCVIPRYILYQYGCSNAKLKVFETRFIKKLPGREVHFQQI